METKPSNGIKELMKNLKIKLQSLFSPQDPQKKKDALPPKTHFSIWYFLIAFLLFTYLQQYFLSRKKAETIPYGQFKQALAEGNVSKLTIGPENITGTLKEKDNKTAREFTTIRVDDPGLVKELDEHKVDYSGRYESKILSSILSWILPIGIMLLIWRYAMKKMGPGWGSCLLARAKPSSLLRVRPGSLSPMSLESMRPKKSSMRWWNF
jgi:cell division protease FtsH